GQGAQQLDIRWTERQPLLGHTGYCQRHASAWLAVNELQHAEDFTLTRQQWNTHQTARVVVKALVKTLVMVQPAIGGERIRIVHHDHLTAQGHSPGHTVRIKGDYTRLPGR